jgi:hypothetical protein
MYDHRAGKSKLPSKEEYTDSYADGRAGSPEQVI